MTNKYEKLAGKWEGIPLEERWKDPEWREFMADRVREGSKKRRGSKLTDAQKAKIASSVKKTWDESPEDPRRAAKNARALEPEKPKKGQKGRKFTEAHKRKLSEAQHTFWDSDRSGAHRKAASERGKRNMTPERRAKQAGYASKTHKGRPKSPEWCEKMSVITSKRIMEGWMPEYYTKRGKYFSEKTKSWHHYRSSYELKAYQLLDADPNVALYLTEPCVIPYEFDGQPRRYVVDLYVEFADGSWQLIEIKPVYALSHPTVQAKLAAANRIYTSEHFTCWTEEHLQ